MTRHEIPKFKMKTFGTPQERIDGAKAAAYMGLEYLDAAFQMLMLVQGESQEYAQQVQEVADKFADELEIMRDYFQNIEKQA